MNSHRHSGIPCYVQMQPACSRCSPVPVYTKRWIIWTAMDRVRAENISQRRVRTQPNCSGGADNCSTTHYLLPPQIRERANALPSPTPRLTTIYDMTYVPSHPCDEP